MVVSAKLCLRPLNLASQRATKATGADPHLEKVYKNSAPFS